MKRLNGREAKALFILSIVVPTGLLTALRLTGVLPEPPTLQTIAVEPIDWQIDRPSMYVDFNETVENTYINEEVSISLGIHISGYSERSFAGIYEGRDGLSFTAHINATIKSGFTASFTVRYLPSENNTFVALVFEDWLRRHNVTVIGTSDTGANSRETYLIAKPTDSRSYLSAISHWIFQNQENENHELKVVLEFSYHNTSVSKKVALPILLEMVRDPGETFDAAKNISFGQYRGCIDLVDYIDTYALAIQEGQTINITMIPPKDANYDLYLYDSNRNIVSNSTNVGNSSESLTYTADFAGTLYLKVHNQQWLGHVMSGIYTLIIKA